MTRGESDYYAFMGFDPESSRHGLRHYVPYLDKVDGAVLELGCGRGEFLDVLAEAGLSGRGVDLDEGMVELARSRGHDVVLGDAVEHLACQPDRSVPAVFCAHLLEHLPVEVVERVYAEVGRALEPGGVFVAVVPNPACLSVLGYDFWRDPTHVRFYDPTLLAFFARRAGLQVAETGGNPRNHPGPPPQVRPPELAGQPALGEQVARLAQIAGRSTPDSPQGAPGPWQELTHLVAALDERLQAVQHQVAVLQAAYTGLLGTLYPPNEVYVVSRRPEVDE